MHFLSLFLQADWVVKSVILGLLSCSIWSWAIILSKFFLLRSLRKESQWILETFSELSLEKGDSGRAHADRPFSYLISLGSQEWERMAFMSLEDRGIMLQRLEVILSIYVEEQKQYLQGSMSILASIGSISPFVGLFGTVWGIMNSFQTMAMANSASLIIVAPGIAEALFATAIGFVVAIPASLGYTRLTSSLYTYGVSLDNFAQNIVAICMKFSSKLSHHYHKDN